MNARNIFAGLLIAVATAPAFAAGASDASMDEGTPPNISQAWKRAQTPMQNSAADRVVPQTLPSRGGEVTLTQDPELNA